MSIDKFDYIEPRCAICEGENFYNPQEKVIDHIPVSRIIEKLDSLLNQEDYKEADRLLCYWQSEAQQANDFSGELTILSEMMGLYRKTNNKEKGLNAVEQGFSLIKKHNLKESVSAATIYINGATTMKAFGKAKDSIQYYEIAEKIYNSNLDQYDIKFGSLYNNMAVALVELEQYDKAEVLYVKALDIMEHNKSYLEVAITEINMAHMLYDSMSEDNEKMVEKILFCMNRAKDILEDTKITHNGYYAFVCSKCINSFGFFGFDTEKELLERRVKEIYDRS